MNPSVTNRNLAIINHLKCVHIFTIRDWNCANSNLLYTNSLSCNWHTVTLAASIGAAFTKLVFEFNYDPPTHYSSLN